LARRSSRSALSFASRVCFSCGDSLRCHW
jgi:hypothetical protein